MAGIWSSLDNIGSFYDELYGRLQQEQRHRLVKRVGPVIHFSTLAFDGAENAPDGYEDDSTLILPERPADFPTEEDWSGEIEDLPFSEPLEDDDEQ